jgi:hypothetical protein
MYVYGQCCWTKVILLELDNTRVTGELEEEKAGEWVASFVAYPA